MAIQSVFVRDEIVPAPDMRPFGSVRGLKVSLWGLPSGLGAARIMDTSTREWMAGYARTLGVEAVFAINGEECNTRVVRADGEHFPSHAWFEDRRVEVFSGAQVDGIYALERNQAFWMRSADCLAIAAVYPSGKMAVVHAGRRSLLPEGWQAGNRLSVVQRLNERMPLEGARAYLVCGVGPESYPVPDDHPTYGPKNAEFRRRVAARWGPASIRETNLGPSLSLVDVARSQLISCGISKGDIHWDGIDTVADVDDEGNFVWGSTVRGGTDGGKRQLNHVLIARV